MAAFSRPIVLLLAVGLLGCDRLRELDAEQGDSLAKRQRSHLALGERVPNQAEALVVGMANEPIKRGSPAFTRLGACLDCPFVFKDEERNASDRRMTPRLRARLVELSRRVRQTWPKVELRVTEAWDDRSEHGRSSVHYEGRAADITTSDQDPKKLGKLAALAVQSGFDWVFYEDHTHVHVSVKRER
ncbi:MAG TPA: D-Ala-D-Ala carboxypeptidase family metallohydrolase [Polyangiaceae bacterium]|nr:D-Ala-D-Ala carboxypeptidase family metallohydrolase [Polyangiaceae bacterium]